MPESQMRVTTVLPVPRVWSKLNASDVTNLMAIPRAAHTDVSHSRLRGVSTKNGDGQRGPRPRRLLVAPGTLLGYAAHPSLG